MTEYSWQAVSVAAEFEKNPIIKGMLTAYAERIKADEGAVAVAYINPANGTLFHKKHGDDLLPLYTRHLTQPAQSVVGIVKVGFLSVQRWKGIDSMINTDFDYAGDLPDGTYAVYVTTAALQEKGNG